MKIAVIGTGNVGSVLGPRWAKNGHAVVFGTRDPNADKIKELLAEAGDKARAAIPAEAAAESDVILLATPWRNTLETIDALGDLTDKIVLDATNPLKADFTGFEIGLDTSQAEQVAERASGAKLAKAFNMTGAGNMANPVYGSQKLSMFVCGDDADAKSTATSLAEELDFEVEDAGGLTVARMLEPLAALWVHLVYIEGWGPDIGFKLLRR